MNSLKSDPAHDIFEIVYDNTRIAPNHDGTINIGNPHLKKLKVDVLYHLGFATDKDDLQAMFGDIRFVCMGGTVKRMRNFAEFVASDMKIPGPLVDLTEASDRYSMFKVGPVLAVSHGMGVSSLSILLHELIKLIYYARAKNVIFFRIGTCGGLGVPAGSVIITNHGVDELLRPFCTLHIMNKIVRRPSTCDVSLLDELTTFAAKQARDHKTVVGNTMCAMDFYEAQSRLDGAFCQFQEEDKFARLKQLQEAGVANIEMEATTFLAMCNYAGIRGAVVCVALVNRLEGDQINHSKEEHEEFQHRPQKFILEYIKSKL